jgi:hypothetical protein
MTRPIAIGVLILAGVGAVGIALAVDGGSAGSGPRLPAPVCGTFDGRGCAPQSDRVDTTVPSFSDPTTIDNPLNPIGELRSALLLGNVDGERLRVETTLLPGTTTIHWGDETIKALASQYVATLDGRIDEVAIDWYAQADDGAVWYLGEDVFNYEDGVIADTEGTWLTGRDGPPAMITPADPEVGDVYRPENIPGIVFEEVTVEEVGRTVAGPHGRVSDAIVVRELHLDGQVEKKVFAPGYGEFSTGSGGDVEALALAVPTDARPGPVPAELATLSTGAVGLVASAQTEDWKGAAATLERVRAAWSAVRAAGVPRLIGAEMRRSLGALTGAVEAERPLRAAHAAIDVAQSALDLELRHRPPVEIDVERFALRATGLAVHAAERDGAGVTGDVAVLEWIRDRVAQVLDARGRAEIDTRLRALRMAADARNLATAADHAARLAARLRHLTEQ